MMHTVFNNIHPVFNNIHNVFNKCSATLCTLLVVLQRQEEVFINYRKCGNITLGLIKNMVHLSAS